MFASLLLAAGVAGSVRPATPPCPAAIALFRDVRAHTGGARWDTVRELVGVGRTFAEGLAGRTRIATDLRTGASSTTDDSGVDYERIVSSPAATWKQDL